MAKITFNDSIGMKIERDGGGVVFEGGTTVSSSPKMTLQSITTASTLTLGGVYTVSGNTAVTVTMPTAASCPGSTFVFRSTSAHAHVLTGSQETSGTKVFAGMFGASGVDGQGSSLALNAVQGSSVALISDGASFLLHALSGSCTISGL